MVWATQVKIYYDDGNLFPGDNTWREIPQKTNQNYIDNKDIYYRSNNNSISFVACYYDTKEEAIEKGRALYYSILYNFLYFKTCPQIGKAYYGNYSFSESSVIYLKHSTRYDDGLRIFELHNNIDEIIEKDMENYCVKMKSCTESRIPFEQISTLERKYNFFSKTVFDFVINSQNLSIGYGITNLCYALEFMNKEKQKKSMNSCLFLDSVLEQLNEETIPDDEKESLRGGINNLKNISIKKQSMQMAISFLGKEYWFFDDKVTNVAEVINEAYKVRNKVSHGAWNEQDEQKLCFSIQDLQLIVLKILEMIKYR